MKLSPPGLVLLALSAAALGSCRSTASPIPDRSGPPREAAPGEPRDAARTDPAPTAAATGAPGGDAPAGSPGEAARPAESWPPGATELVANAGGFRLRFASEPAPLPTNEPCRLLVGVTGPSGEPLGDGARLAVDGWMPDHLHGLVRQPRVRELEPGRWAVEGLLLHMPGRWELFFDLTRGALTERAQTELELD